MATTALAKRNTKGSEIDPMYMGVAHAVLCLGSLTNDSDRTEALDAAVDSITDPEGAVVVVANTAVWSTVTALVSVLGKPKMFKPTEAVEILELVRDVMDSIRNRAFDPSANWVMEGEVLPPREDKKGGELEISEFGG